MLHIDTQIRKTDIFASTGQEKVTSNKKQDAQYTLKANIYDYYLINKYHRSS